MLIKLVGVHLLLLTSSLALAEIQNTPAPVRIIAFSELATAIDKSTPATVINLSDATISAEISAPIAEIHHRVGETVK